MPRWSDEWLTTNERKRLQVGQQGIKARQRKQEHEANRGYPRSSIPISQPEKAPQNRKDVENQVKYRAKNNTSESEKDQLRQAYWKALRKGGKR